MSIGRLYIPRVLGLVVLAALLFGAIAYQFRPAYSVPVGSWYDRTALRDGWWDDEIADGVRYRWTKGQAEIELAELGTLRGGDYEMRVYAQFAPQNVAPPIELSYNGDPTSISFEGTDATQGLYIAHISQQLVEKGGSSPHITLRVPTFNAAGDSRDLGIKVLRIAIARADNNNFTITIPPLAALFYLVVIAVCGYLVVTRRRILGAALSLLALAVASYSIIINPVLGVWLLPASAWLALFITLTVWRDKLFGWYPRWLDRVREWPSQQNRSREALSTQGEISRRISDSAFTGRNAKLILLVAVALYAVFTLWLTAQVDFIGHADYADNAVVARNIVRGNGAVTDYVAQFYTPYASVRHAADTWPLLQPLLTVPFVAISDSTLAAKLPNVILAILLVLSVYYVGRRLWDARVGVLGALLVLVYPYLLNMVVYPVNDLVFSLLFLWLLYIVVAYRLAEANWRAWVAWGGLAGLFVWAKPSGAIVLVALFGYALWLAWRQRQRMGALRRAAINTAIVAAIALAIVSPLLVRNLSTFHAPFYSTESYDAWILKWYPPFERIYAAYPQNDLPNRSWLLRYGFDAMYRAVGRETQALWGGNSPTGGGSGLLGGLSDYLNEPAHDPTKLFSSGDMGSTVAVVLAILALLVAPRRWGERANGLYNVDVKTTETDAAVVSAMTPNSAQRAHSSLVLPLLISLIAYAAFLVTYWHYEPRYFQPYAVWVMLLAAAAIWWLYDVLVRRTWAGAMLIAGGLALALIGPAMLEIASVTPIYAGATPLVEAAQWFKANTPTDAVAMSRNPWEFSWHSDRMGVMVPLAAQDLNRSLPQIKQVAQQYHVSYLMLDHLGPPGATYFRSDWRKDIAPMYNQRTACKGFTLIYQNKSVVIYKMNVGEIGTTCSG